MQILKHFKNETRKGVKEMKKLRALISMALVMVFSLTQLTYAATIDQTQSVIASATIIGTTSLSLDVATLTYGATGADAFPTIPGTGRVVVTYSSNHTAWKLMTYTDNTVVANYSDNGTPADPSDDTGRYAKGGLATTTGSAVVACKWICQDDATAAPAIGSIGSYNFVKDLRDEDDPSTPYNDGGTPTDPSDDTGANESWATGLLTGYPNIAFGGPGYGFCVDPSAGAPYTGDAADGTIALYVAGLFGTGGVTPAAPAAAGTYSSNIYVELLHE